MDYPIRFTEQLREHIRALRRKRGLTQSMLGQRLGVGQARIAEIERTPGLVSLDQMVKLMSVLGASLVLSVTDKPIASVGAGKAKAAPAPRKAARATTRRVASTPRRTRDILPKKGAW